MPFIGAGPSVPLGEPAYPELLREMKEKLRPGINPRVSRKGASYPRQFSALCREARDRGQFFQTLFGTLVPKTTRFTGFHHCLVKTFDAYVTTNWDYPIEDTYKEVRQHALRKYYFSCYELDHLKGCVVYLHGHKDIGFAIVTKEDYDYFYPTVSTTGGIPILERFLESLYRHRRILFLGVSFDDGYVHEFLRHLSLKNVDSKHFWILDEGTNAYDSVAKAAAGYASQNQNQRAQDLKARFYEKFGKVGIRPIVYRADQHIFVEQLLLQLKPTEAPEATAANAAVP